MLYENIVTGIVGFLMAWYIQQGRLDILDGRYRKTSRDVRTLADVWDEGPYPDNERMSAAVRQALKVGRP